MRQGNNYMGKTSHSQHTDTSIAARHVGPGARPRMHFCPPCGNLLLLEVCSHFACALVPRVHAPYLELHVSQNLGGQMRFYCQACPYVYTLKHQVRTLGVLACAPRKLRPTRLPTLNLSGIRAPNSSGIANAESGAWHPNAGENPGAA